MTGFYKTNSNDWRSMKQHIYENKEIALFFFIIGAAVGYVVCLIMR